MSTGSLTGRQIRALCYLAMMILVAISWQSVGAAIVLAFLDFLDAEKSQPDSNAEAGPIDYSQPLRLVVDNDANRGPGVAS